MNKRIIKFYKNKRLYNKNNKNKINFNNKLKYNNKNY